MKIDSYYLRPDEHCIMFDWDNNVYRIKYKDGSLGPAYSFTKAAAWGWPEEFFEWLPEQ